MDLAIGPNIPVHIEYGHPDGDHYNVFDLILPFVPGIGDNVSWFGKDGTRYYSVVREILWNMMPPGEDGVSRLRNVNLIVPCPEEEPEE